MRNMRLTGAGFAMFVATLSAMTAMAGMSLDPRSPLVVDVPQRTVVLPLTSVPSVEVGPLIRPFGMGDLLGDELDRRPGRGGDWSFQEMPSPVPWPTAVSLMAMVGLGVRHRRRRRVS